MLNMAPDKAADETISFQCYPLPAALLYTGRPALTAGSSFFFSLSLSFSGILSLFLSFYIFACIGSSFYLPFPSSPQKIYLPHRSFSLLYLHSVLVSSRCSVHVQSEIRRKDRDKELLIFSILLYLSSTTPRVS